MVGIFNVEGTPVPIPNTEVKLLSGEDTRSATTRENNSMPTQCGFSSFGRARPCQGRGGGFEPRNPLHQMGKHENVCPLLYGDIAKW